MRLTSRHVANISTQFSSSVAVHADSQQQPHGDCPRAGDAESVIKIRVDGRDCSGFPGGSAPIHLASVKASKAIPDHVVVVGPTWRCWRHAHRELAGAIL